MAERALALVQAERPAVVAALRPADVMLIIGVRGTGKSWWAKAHAMRLAAACQSRLVVWDPNGEWRAGFPGNPESAPQCSQLDVDGLELHLLTHRNPKKGALCVSVTDWPRDRAAQAERWERFVGVVEACGNLVLFVEEAGLLVGVRRAHDDLDHLVVRSRHRGIPVVMIAQRATRQLPVTARDQASRIVAFRQTNPRDVEALAEVMGPTAQRLPSLPRQRPVMWHEGDAFNTTTPPRRGRSS